MIFLYPQVRVPGADSNRYVVLVGQNNYYTEYDVMVQAANDQGLGEISNSVPIHSAEDSECPPSLISPMFISILQK